ncbi:arylsulfatase [Rhodopirellula rubra]|uniref:Arylsulfatase n=1 Tax=Aporhodopirellula rubra TaxID=980271 RepID=A0A7W5H8P5_9BACT|nr:arylsulfatase [Aporhodopirellula rubra]MBB3209693.1 arylsulfatase [Aporhodopirellula rubra]
MLPFTAFESLVRMTPHLRGRSLNRPVTLIIALIVMALPQLVEAPRLHAESNERPNIIYILADDMGFSDIGCYGSEIETPVLDSLAENGLRFTQFYNTARCCPTRASLLTGLYPHQAGVGHMMEDRGHDGYRGQLNRRCVTIAEVLRPAGYRTYLSGKWHVTPFSNKAPDADKSNWPRQRGFDRFYGTIHGAGSFWDPNSLTRDNTRISPASDPEYPLESQVDGEFYYTDAITDHATRFIQEHHEESADKPFFLYVAYTAAHWPMHARERDIAKYEGRYDAGYDAIRDSRYQRMLDLGVIDAESTVNWPIPDSWKVKNHWEWDKRNMEVYAAMVDSMDQGIGKIVQSLKSTGQYDNTLICFLQDNGGCAESFGRNGKHGPRAAEPNLAPLPADHLQMDMAPKQTRDGYPVRGGHQAMAGPADTYVAYGRGWATVSNTPFREYKHWVHEGGISTPLIAHWPRGISRHGELESTPGHLVDLMATAVDLSGAEYPQKFHGDNEIHPMEGRSLKPLFEGQSIDREAIFWEHEGNRAVRAGDYKLVAKGPKGAWELYDISRDRSEQNDLSQEKPEIAEKLMSMWQEYAERAFVLPGMRK